ncbi:MAG: bifunctional nuclease domain-containing protein [Leptonema sp. (in: bacteria)]
MIDEEIFEVKISDISVTTVGFALIFKPAHFPSKEVVPIFIGPLEAYSISNELQGIKNPRPNTHDLMVKTLHQLGARLLRVIINDIVGNIFYAILVLQMEDRIIEIDARPSDSVALAIRVGCPIFMHKKVFQESAVVISSGEEEQPIVEEEPLKQKSPLEILQGKLQKAIEEENYEEAARIRDEIKHLKQKDN